LGKRPIETYAGTEEVLRAMKIRPLTVTFDKVGSAAEVNPLIVTKTLEKSDGVMGLVPYDWPQSGH